MNDGRVRLSELGQLVETEWADLPRRFSCLALDSLVVMPDHLHAILWILDPTAQNGPSARHGPSAGSVGAVIGRWKSRVTKAANAAELWPAGKRLWHRGYHDRRLRSELAVLNARAYIAMNPIRWERDRGR